MAEVKRIWDYLLSFIGSPFGTAGLMGNLQAESGLEPVCLEASYRKKLGMTSREYTDAVDSGRYTAFVSDGAGFGLQQLSYREHKDGLLSFARAKGKSVGDLQVQLEYLRLDLNRFGAVLGTLKTATSVREASDDVLLRYEKPADTSEKTRQKRAAYGEYFYKTYADPDWEKRMKKALTVISSCRSRLGDPYVFAALGEECTPGSRRKYERPDYPSIADDCPVLSGRRSSCAGCRYQHRHIYDCRGFVYRVFLDAGIRISGAGATSQWNTASNWAAAGLTDDMPDLVCALYKRKGSTMSHTGVHLGNGRIIHCSGTVKDGSISDRSWTHWAIPIGLYTQSDIDNAGRLHAVANLKRGSTGEAVRRLQERLNELGYSCGTADGVFGAKTEAAVRRFQADHGLTVDGVAGMATQAALDGGGIPPGEPLPDPGDDADPSEPSKPSDHDKLLDRIALSAQAILDAVNELRM